MQRQHKGREGEAQVYYRKVGTLYVKRHNAPEGRSCYAKGVHFKPSSHHENKSRKLELMSPQQQKQWDPRKGGSIKTVTSSKEGRKGGMENGWGKSNTSSAMTDLKPTRPIVTFNVNG